MKTSTKKISRNALLYLIAIIFFYISSGAFSMLQGIYIKELNIGEDFLGLILSLRTLAIAALSVPCAVFVNKYGKKKGILMSMMLVPLATIFQGYSQDKWLILILGILQGGASAFIAVSEGPFFMENSSEKNRLNLFSFAFADNVFSTMLGYFVFGKISDKLYGTYTIINALRYSIIISGIIGLISCVFIIMIKEQKQKFERNSTVFYKSMYGILKQKYTARYLVYNSIIGFGAGLVVPYFNVYLRYRVNATTEQIGIIMALAQGAMGIGGLITPFMALRFGRIRTIITCQIASIPFLMLIALPPSLIIVSVALFIRNALMNMAGPIINNLSMELIKSEDRSIFASANNISGNACRALSAVVGGFIMKNFTNGYEMPYFITAILYIIATVYFYNSFKSFDKKVLINA